MRSLLRDVRYGYRSLLRSKPTFFVAVLALAFGIGLCTTMYSILYGALMTEPPYPEGDRVVAINQYRRESGPEPMPLPVHDFAEVRSAQRSFLDVGAYTAGTAYLSGTEGAERFEGTWVTASTFDILRVGPALGRTFRPGDDAPSAPKVVVLAHETWRQRYAADPSVIGTSVRLNGQPHTIVGVMPADFKFAQNGQLFMPLVIDVAATPRGRGAEVHAFGRLETGVTVRGATADLATISARLAASYPETNKGSSTFAARFVDAYLAPPPRMLLKVMLGAVFLVLLVACANVANLLLDRAVHRAREVGVRMALGAPRRAIVQQFLAESLLISAIATVGAIGIAYVGVGMFDRATANTGVPFWMSFRLHPAVFWFAGAVALMTTLVAGAIPAWQSSRADINEVLKDESRGASSFRIGCISNSLVVFEVALSCTLLVAAGLMIKSVVEVNRLDRGYDMKHVFTARVGFPDFFTDTSAAWRFFDELLPRVESVPRVRAAALTSGLPTTRAGLGGTRIALPGQTYAKPDEMPRARMVAATPGFFAAIRTPVIAGRDFTAGDRSGSDPVAIVSKGFADKYLPSGDALGQRVRLGAQADSAPWVTIVGVSGNMFDMDEVAPPIVFRPLAQARSRFVTLVARTDAEPMGLTPAIRETVRSLDPDIALYWVQSFEEASAQATWFIRVFGTLFIVFGAVALFLASVGLYAVMSFAVTRRTREFGIRMALGATARDVVTLTVGKGAVRLVLGMIIGLALGLAVSRLLGFLLFQVRPSDPSVFGGVAAVLLVVGVVASLIPALRATRVDPVSALRRE